MISFSTASPLAILTAVSMAAELKEFAVAGLPDGYARAEQQRFDWRGASQQISLRLIDL